MRAASERWLALLPLLLACSATRFDNNPCRQDSECRAAFGFGAICGRSGFCTDARPSARCNVSHPPDLLTQPFAHRRTVVLGSLMDRSSEANAAQERAIRLAIKSAGEAGGVDGRPLGLVMCDIRADASLGPGSRSEAAADSAGFLARTLGVAAIVGPASSADTERAWQAVREAGTLVISPAATSAALAGLEGQGSDEQPGLLWRTAPSDSLQGRAIAEDMLARGVKVAHVVRENGAYGEGLAGAFLERFARGMGSAQVTAIASEAQLGPAAAGAAAGEASEVLFVSSQPTWIVAFLNAAGREPGFAARTIFLTDAAADPALLAQATGATALFARVRGARPAARDAGEQVLADFLARYRAEYDGAEAGAAAFAPHAWDAAWLSVYGAAWALLREGAVSGAGIARGLRRMSAGTPLAVGPGALPAVLAAFRAGQSINVSGASGELDYNAATRELVGPVEIWTIDAKGGQFTTVRLETRTPH